MSITTEEKQAIVSSYGYSPNDTGSTEVQVAILTRRIENLSLHLKTNNKHDFQSGRGLIQMVHKRKRLLQYLMRTANPRYITLIEKLKIRGVKKKN